MLLSKNLIHVFDERFQNKKGKKENKIKNVMRIHRCVTICNPKQQAAGILSSVLYISP